MELCTSAALSNGSHITVFNPNPNHFGWRTRLPLNPKSVPLTNSGLRQYISVLVRAGMSKETSKSTQLYNEERDGIITMTDESPVEKSFYNETVDREVSVEESPLDEQTIGFDFLNKLNEKVDSENAYQFLIYGSGALVTVWLASAIVGAIDSIPVFPKLMEVVGVAYTVWFSSRNLLFKRNRDELGAKLEELKRQVLGLDD